MKIPGHVGVCLVNLQMELVDPRENTDHSWADNMPKLLEVFDEVSLIDPEIQVSGLHVLHMLNSDFKPQLDYLMLLEYDAVLADDLQEWVPDLLQEYELIT
ncbi:MAG: hypothetical protein AAF352_01985, partial [Pseudomonadota bacterium]